MNHVTIPNPVIEAVATAIEAYGKSIGGFTQGPIIQAHAPNIANAAILAHLLAIREPTAEMIAATLPFVDAPTYGQQQLAKVVIALLPPARAEQRFKGEMAAAELVRDWSSMIDQLIASVREGQL